MARPDEVFLGLYEHPFVGPDGRITQIWYDALQALNARSNSSGAGTVTSVALTAPPEFTVTGSPVTTNGTIAIDKATESANTVWAGPTTGAAAQPAFRALVAADVPSGFVTGSSLTSGAVIVGAGGSTIVAAANSVAILRSITTLTDAQIKALPTTPITLVTSPTSGSRVKLLGVTLSAHFSSGAYASIDATGSDLVITGAFGDWLVSPVVNDTGAGITLLTDFFAAANTVTDVVPVGVYPTGGWLKYNDPPTPSANVDAALVQITMDNSINLTGGNAANTLKVTVYYVVEVL